MKMYVGIDLHSNNNHVAILDERLESVFCRRLRNNLVEVLAHLEPYRSDIASIAVESTYNWYWLVDGLMVAGYDLRLVNTTKASDYHGMKYTDDRHDARWIARLMALGILPEGFIMPPDQRAVRDLLRKRSFMVRKLAAFINSLKCTFTRSTGLPITTDEIRRWTPEAVRDLIDDRTVAESIAVMLPVIRSMTSQIDAVERSVCNRVKETKVHQLLRTVPGLGPVLAMTIHLETGDISRFAKVGNYASYCRCVRSEKRSNDKKKGVGNRKNGNRFLSWAFAELAHHTTRYDPNAKLYLQRKSARCHVMVARQALANKLSRSCYFIMRDHVPFDSRRLYSS